jgi:hypothetical protein
VPQTGAKPDPRSGKVSETYKMTCAVVWTNSTCGELAGRKPFSPKAHFPVPAYFPAPENHRILENRGRRLDSLRYAVPLKDRFQPAGQVHCPAPVKVRLRLLLFRPVWRACRLAFLPSFGQPKLLRPPAGGQRRCFAAGPTINASVFARCGDEMNDIAWAGYPAACKTGG